MAREPLETKERRCPACASDAITPANHLLAINDQAINVTKEKFRCAACGDRVLVRTIIVHMTRLRAA